MKIDLKLTNIEPSESLEKYVIKRFSSLGKFVKEEDKENTVLIVELTRETRHHRKSDQSYKVHCHINYLGKDLIIEQFADDIFKAIDLAKDRLKRVMSEEKNKK